MAEEEKAGGRALSMDMTLSGRARMAVAEAAAAVAGAYSRSLAATVASSSCLQGGRRGACVWGGL